mmetsp:Transcript_7789/g.19806  ORF Transcript_7789/g.19806 Transcript_7789/m.19806 type:complete len:304 (+) Transcript_7789:69-980(+)
MGRATIGTARPHRRGRSSHLAAAALSAAGVCHQLHLDGPTAAGRLSSQRVATFALLPSWLSEAAVNMPRSRSGSTEASFSEYRLLISSEIPELDVEGVARELEAEAWTEDSLLVKALVKEGAKNVATLPWTGRSREMTFDLRLGIPWETVRAYMQLSGRDREESMVTPTLAETEITARHSVYVSPSELVMVESTYAVASPALNLKMLFALHPASSIGGGEYIFGVAVEYPPGHTASFLEYPIIRDFMNIGLVEASRHYGKTLLVELRGRASAPSSLPATTSGRGTEGGQDSSAPWWRRLHLFR